MNTTHQTLPSPAGPWGSPRSLDTCTVSRAGGRDEVAMENTYLEGHAAGLNEAGLPSYNIGCPYDGRTKAGKEWWRGFMEGDRERCARLRSAETETVKCEVNFATGEFREVPKEPEAVTQAAEPGFPWLADGELAKLDAQTEPVSLEGLRKQRDTAEAFQLKLQRDELADALEALCCPNVIGWIPIVWTPGEPGSGRQEARNFVASTQALDALRKAGR